MQKNAICMIFLAAVDEFDTYVVLEDKERNRLQESAEIFTQLRVSLVFLIFNLVSLLMFNEVNLNVFVDHIALLSPGSPMDPEGNRIHSLPKQGERVISGHEKIKSLP